ncbi:hypothetical protein FUAX_36930 [Fulvitalea axinellae]|uniref:Carbonic anhydrase n=2 Tax=Fulvitalea axinellae TaxID=1182444 RepID=A0AAU9DDJ5_9BACT|nr:hypothetical protein FUAX_36930 [Fulvitalea axinellae]
MIMALAVFAGCESERKKKEEEKETEESNMVKMEAPGEHKGEKVQGYTLPGLGHGLLQSPINILSADTEHDGKHHITLHFNDKFESVENLGHTVQLNFEEGSTLESDGKTYDFVQLHFHTPSEHLIDGVTFPMEMHIVNSLQNQDQDKPEYLVIGILFKMGKENPFLKDFIDKIPTEEHVKQMLPVGSVQMGDLLMEVGGKSSHFYYYKGSLTTPPFTESVNWHIMKVIQEASPEQIQKINRLEGNNARHVQGMYGRMVDSE